MNLEHAVKVMKCVQAEYEFYEKEELRLCSSDPQERSSSLKRQPAKTPEQYQYWVEVVSPLMFSHEELKSLSRIAVSTECDLDVGPVEDMPGYVSISFTAA